MTCARLAVIEAHVGLLSAIVMGFVGAAEQAFEGPDQPPPPGTEFSAREMVRFLRDVGDGRVGGSYDFRGERHEYSSEAPSDLSWRSVGLEPIARHATVREVPGGIVVSAEPVADLLELGSPETPARPVDGEVGG